jgi:hypothetical protein
MTAEGKHLTELGKSEMFNLGKYFQKRYSGYIKTGFDSEEVTFISSDTDRTLKSASLFACGLYNNFNFTESWTNWNLNCGGVPIHSIPREIDRFIQSTRDCPRYDDQLLQESFDTCYSKFKSGNPNVIDAFVQLTGNTIPNDPNRAGLDKIAELIVLAEEIALNRSNNAPLNNEAQALLQQFPEFLRVQSICLQETLGTPEKQRLYSGSLMQMILTNFRTEKAMKLVAYAAHDRTLIGQLSILGVSLPDSPPPGTALILELHETETQRPHVKLWYRNDTTTDPFALELPDCPQPCYLETLFDLKADLFPVDFERECRAG